jgi:hypothetical protein
MIAFFILLSFGLARAQVDLNEVDLKKIEQKTIRELLKQQKLYAKSFKDLELSVDVKDDLTSFLTYEKEYLVKEPIDFVWDSYKQSSQTDIWDLNKISFALLFSRSSGSVTYANQDCRGLERGLIFYLNLKILNGFYNLPVAFEIVNVDEEKKLIELSYLQGGKTRGKQVIILQDTDKGYTRILHKSVVKSESKIRDRYLYPYFHNKLINEFHANMKRLIARESRSGARLFAASRQE